MESQSPGEFEYYCEACGKEVSENASVCPNCGALLTDEEMDGNCEFEYYCDACGAEVKKEDTVCTHCGAPLEESDGNDEFVNPVAVRSYDMDIDADIAVQHLKSGGVFAYVMSDGTGLMRPNLMFSSGAKVMVREVDLKTADEILKAMGM